MTTIVRHIEIDASPGDVFDVLADLDRLPNWSTITVETHDTPSPPLEPGQTFRQTLRVLGRNIEATWRVESVERPSRLMYDATGPHGAKLRMQQRLRDTGGATQVELEIDYELPGGILGDVLDAAYVERRNEREAEHSLHNLKDFVEAHTQR